MLKGPPIPTPPASVLSKGDTQLLTLTPFHFPQSSYEEDSLSESRLSTKAPTAKCEPRLPAIDQTSVKQKHKGTMTLKKSEKVSPSKPSPGEWLPY